VLRAVWLVDDLGNELASFVLLALALFRPAFVQSPVEKRLRVQILRGAVESLRVLTQRGRLVPWQSVPSRLIILIKAVKHPRVINYAHVLT
jgi:hypothetical protein